MQRRDFFKNALGLAGMSVVGMSTASLYSQEKAKINRTGAGRVAPDPLMTGYADPNEHEFWFRMNNTPFTSYRAHTTQKYPYFYPLNGPASGISITSETSSPWPHHRSLFFGSDKVNGDGNYWHASNASGQILSRSLKLKSVTEKEAKFSNVCVWKKPETDPIIEDTRNFTIRFLENGNYIIDSSFTLKMLTDVTFEKTNHSLFAVRCAYDLSPDGGGTLLNSEGQSGETDTFGKPARWCAFFGKREKLKEEIVEGIAVILPKVAPHPAFENCPWFTRNYGNFSPTPLQWLTQKIPFAKGEQITFRYRTVAFQGTPKEANLDGLWEDFS